MPRCTGNARQYEGKAGRVSVPQAPQERIKKIGCCSFLCSSQLFILLDLFPAVFAQAELSAGINFQFFRRVKQADGDFPHLSLLAAAVNMHGIGFAVDHKVADRQGASLLSFER